MPEANFNSPRWKKNPDADGWILNLHFRDASWKFFFNLAGSELPLMPIDDIEQVLSRVPANEVSKMAFSYQNF